MPLSSDNEIARENLEDLYPLSPMQESMLFHALMHPDSQAYFVQQGYRVRGSLNIALVEQAWNHLIARHQILRTVIVAEKARRPLQMVLRSRRVTCRCTDLTGVDSDAQQEQIDAIREDERRESFRLERDVLVRLHVVQLDENLNYVLWNVHHIVLDGWCMSILQQEFIQVYQALRSGLKPQLPPAVTFGRYITWLEEQNKDAAISFWREELAGYEAPVQLPGQPASEATAGAYQLETISRSIDPEMWQLLESRAAEWRVTPGTLLQVVWAILLGRWNLTDDVVFGAVVSGRPAELDDVEGMLGLFMNTIPVRVRLASDDTLQSLATRRQNDMLESEPHQFVPLSEVQAASVPGSRLLNHIVAFENYPVSGNAADDTVTLSIESTDRFEQTGYDFVLVVLPGEITQVEFQFNECAFARQQIERLADQFLHLLQQAIQYPKVPVSEFCLTPTAELERLAGFNATQHEWDDCTSFVEQFARHVNERPNSQAVTDCEGSFTYAELNTAANVLAGSLKAADCVDNGRRVAVVVERSRWLPVALVGAMKSGAVYVPIDPEQPAARLRLMLEEAECSAIVTDGDLRWNTPAIASADGNAVPVIDIRQLHPPVEGPGETCSTPEPGDVAYMIFTSRFIRATQSGDDRTQNVSHLISWNRSYHGFDHTSRSTLFASPGFDASCWEMFPCLASGGCLNTVPQAARIEPAVLAQFLRASKITHSFVPTALCQQLLQEPPESLPQNLRLLTGGETLRPTELPASTSLYNHYGPTECTVLVTAGEVTQTPGETPSIGHPIHNTAIHILDNAGQPAGIGCPGEICASGATVGRGYWNRAALTAESFVPSPLGAGTRMYRTGDLGSWREDGSITFLGRRDQQVKLRGHRIEIGEIEYAITQLSGIEAAAVVVCRSVLLAFVVIDGAEESVFDPQSLRESLQDRLPGYMIPARVVPVDEIPLTNRSKVDRRQLTALGLSELNGSQSTQELKELQTETQRIVAAIWAGVLEISAAGLGPQDDFYAIGGHSLAATRIVAQVKQQTGIRVPLRTVFEATTLAEFAARVDQEKNQETKAATQEPVAAATRGPVALPRTARARPDS